jgi:hypothetical protein
VYVRCILPGKQDHVRRYIFLTLENLLGERSKALDVEVKDIESRWLAPAKAKLHKLEDLPGFIGGMNSGITIGPAGKIDGW